MDNPLFQAILADPDDDELRLVYADWLEDRGDCARAELIRVQLALGEMDYGDPEAATLWQRQGALLREHQDALQAELPELPEGLAWGDFRRGFVEAVIAVRRQELLAFEEQILAAIPLRRLVLVCWNADESLAGSRLLGRVRELVLRRNHHTRPSPQVDDPVFEAVLAWPEMKQLTHLRLDSPEISEVGLAALARADLAALTALRWERYYHAVNNLEPVLESRWLPGLERLELEYHALTGEPFRRLCGRLVPGRLRRLALKSASLTDADMAVLAGSGLLAGLELLDLERNAIGPEGTRDLVRHLPATARLLLDNNPIGDEGFQALLGSPLLARHTLLRWNSGTLGNEVAFAVARSPHAHRLETLYLPNQQIVSAGLEAVLNSPNLPALKLVNLERNRIEALPACRHPTLEGLYVNYNGLADAGLTAFCAGSYLPALNRLGLEGNRLGSEAIRALTGATGLPALKQLFLSSNPLGDDAASLLDGPGLPALEELAVQDCGIGDATLDAWARSPRLSRLKQLKLESDGNPISREAYTVFCEAAYRLGCNVDHWSSHPRLRPIRRPSHGPLPPEERAMLARWIDGLMYAEYHTVAWLKATSFSRLRECVDRPRDMRSLEQYLRGENVDDTLRRAMIGLFLREWMISQVPESVGAFGLDPEEFQVGTREEALALVDEIIATSLADERGGIHGVPPRYVIGEDAPAETFVVTGDEEEEDIPYPRLRTWFAEELFDADQAVFFVHSAPGGPTVRFNVAHPRVIGMDREIIGMLWLE
jgi:uncharacterized protein (TIGR02996 family)